MAKIVTCPKCGKKVYRGIVKTQHKWQQYSQANAHICHRIHIYNVEAKGYSWEPHRGGKDEPRSKF